MRGLGTVTLAGTLLVSSVAQEATRPRQTVLYVAESQSVPAGKLAMVELRFRVLDGYHVNSHTPKSEFLVPTVVRLEPASGVAAGVPVYAPGQEFRFAASPDETLDVYTGEFVVKLPVTASAGEHTVAGSLRYQACDKAACFPAKTLALAIPVTGR